MDNLSDFINNKADMFKKADEIQPINKSIIKNMWQTMGASFDKDFKLDKLSLIYANYFSSSTEQIKGKGLMVLGAKGIGKTLNFLIYQRIQTSLGKSMDIMCLEVKEIEHLYKIRGQNFIDEMLNVPELIINDVGTDTIGMKNYGSSVELVNEILLLRYSKWQKIGGAMRTHISSNLEPEQLKAMYGDRIYDRFKEMFWLIVSDNKESYRK